MPSDAPSDPIEEVVTASEAVCDFFRETIVPIFETRPLDLEIACFQSNDFNAAAETIDLQSFDIFLYYGFTDRIYKSIDVPDEPLQSILTLSEALFGHQIHYEATCRCVMYFSIVFALLHEYSHIACGHLHAMEFPDFGSNQARARLTLKEIPDRTVPPRRRFHLSGVSETEVSQMETLNRRTMR